MPAPAGSGPRYRRPVAVVQGDALNQSRISTVVCVPLTSNLKWSLAPGNVSLSATQVGVAIFGARSGTGKVELVPPIPSLNSCVGETEAELAVQGSHKNGFSIPGEYGDRRVECTCLSPCSSTARHRQLQPLALPTRRHGLKRKNYGRGPRPNQRFDARLSTRLRAAVFIESAVRIARRSLGIRHQRS